MGNTRPRPDGGVITIPEGIWDFDKLNSYINSQINDNNPINITFDRNTLYTTIKIKENYSLDLSQSNFNNLLGFKKKLNSGTHQ